MTRDEKRELLYRLANAALKNINLAGARGIPAGPMYTVACVPIGMSLEFFNAMMTGLVTTGHIIKQGDRYYPVKPQATQLDKAAYLAVTTYSLNLPH
jgi:hypothetical protein